MTFRPAPWLLPQLRHDRPDGPDSRLHPGCQIQRFQVPQGRDSAAAVQDLPAPDRPAGVIDGDATTIPAVDDSTRERAGLTTGSQPPATAESAFARPPATARAALTHDGWRVHSNNQGESVKRIAPLLLRACGDGTAGLMSRAGSVSLASHTSRFRRHQT